MILKNIKFPSNGYDSPWLSYWTVAFIVILFIVYKLFIYETGHIYSDTMSYYHAGDLLVNGIVDDVRTPVYPLILKVFKVLFGFEGSMIAVILFQTIVFVISIMYVNKSLGLLVPQFHRLRFWLTLFYVLLIFSRGALGFDSIQSDALAIYFSAFLSYCIIRLGQSEAPFRYAIWTSVWLSLLVFLRPILICYIPVVVFFWVALYLKYHRKALKKCLIGIGGVVVIVVLLGGYYCEINKRYHIHSISFVSVVNNYAMLRYGGIISPDDTDNPWLKRFIEERIAIKAIPLSLAEQFQETEILLASPYYQHPIFEQAVNHAIRTHPCAVIQTIIQRFKTINSLYVQFINVSILLVFCTLLVYSFLFLQVPLVPWTLFLFVISLWASMFIGAMGEWRRLSAPMYSMFVLIVGWAFSKLRLLPPDTE